MVAIDESPSGKCPCANESESAREMAAILTEDELRLSRLGYKQEAKRIFGLWSNFGLAASMISVILGIIPLYTYSLTNGGKSLNSKII